MLVMRWSLTMWVQWSQWKHTRGNAATKANSWEMHGCQRCFSILEVHEVLALQQLCLTIDLAPAPLITTASPCLSAIPTSLGCSSDVGFLLQRFSEKRGDWIWFSLGLHVFTVTFFPHLARFSGHNFPLWWSPYWRLWFSRHSRVKPGGRLSVHSPLQSPVWLTSSKRAFLPFLVRRHALLLCKNESPKEKQEL